MLTRASCTSAAPPLHLGQATTIPEGAKKAADRVVKLLEDVKAGHVTRSAWENGVKQFLVDGHARRAHLLSLVSIEVLRAVGIGAKELHDGGLSLVQLKAGAFTAHALHMHM